MSKLKIKPEVIEASKTAGLMNMFKLPSVDYTSTQGYQTNPKPKPKPSNMLRTKLLGGSSTAVKTKQEKIAALCGMFHILG